MFTLVLSFLGTEVEEVGKLSSGPLELLPLAAFVEDDRPTSFWVGVLESQGERRRYAYKLQPKLATIATQKLRIRAPLLTWRLVTKDFRHTF